MLPKQIAYGCQTKKDGEDDPRIPYGVQDIVMFFGKMLKLGVTQNWKISKVKMETMVEANWFREIIHPTGHFGNKAFQGLRNMEGLGARKMKMPRRVEIITFPKIGIYFYFEPIP
ncbi:MAG: hypothetical protein IPN74_08625 [Haliscomenobacter sp.]|nr:hypothetical protein [Haliscomenobacter sp.]